MAPLGCRTPRRCAYDGGVGLSWTGTDEEAARVLTTWFDNFESMDRLVGLAGESPLARWIPPELTVSDAWQRLVAALRRSRGPRAIERLLEAAVDVEPKLAADLRSVGTVPPNYGPESQSASRQLDKIDWESIAAPLPSLGLDSRFSGHWESLADDVADAAAPRAEPLDEATGFARDPALATLVPPRAGGPLVLSVDLARPRGTSGEQIVVSGLPEDWASLPLLARATGAGVTFEAGCAEGVVLVRRNATSIPCTLVGAIAPDAEHVEIAITFHDRGRYCGEIRRRLALDGVAQPIAASDATAGGAMIEPGIPAPDLTVVVRNLDATRPGLLHWDLRLAERHQATAIHDLPRELSGKIDLDGDPRRWALDLFDEFATAGDGADLSLLESIGEKLWQATPECFRQTYWALRGAVGEHFSIQLVCGDPFVPWEFLRPTRGDEALPILMQNHPVARWMPAHAGASRGVLGHGRIVTIASPRPSSPPLPELKAATAQSDRLRERFDAEPWRATKQDVMALLASTPDSPVAILHFACHGAIDANLDKARIFLDDGPLQSLLVDSSRVTLGRAGRTLVFLNACSVGQDGRALGTPAGWPAAFLNRAFRGFLAPISKVWELDAAQFAERFVALTWRDRLPIGEALQQLRAKADSATPFAYIYYGDVMARFA